MPALPAHHADRTPPASDAPGASVAPPSPAPGLRKITSRTVVDEVYQQVRAMILTGALEPDTRLIELDLAGQMGTSQASVREAIQRLERDGFVERRPRLGSFVTRVSPEDMHEILEVRIAIERVAARRAATRITPAQAAELRAVVDRMRDAGRARDVVALTEQDLAFHRHVCTWADHPSLLRAWVPLSTQVQRFMVIAQPYRYPDLAVLAETHLPIVDVLERGDPDAAMAVVSHHIEQMWRDFVRLDPAARVRER